MKKQTGNTFNNLITLQLGLFCGLPCLYASLSEFSFTTQDTVDLIMATINQVQALYMLPSLKVVVWDQLMACN